MQWLLSLVFLVGSARPLPEDARFVDATAHMKKLDYEAALASFDKLLAEPRPDDEKTQLLLWSGAARALLGDEGGARLAFDAALRVDPKASIGFKTSPKVIELFDAVRAAQPPSTTAPLDTTPSPSPSMPSPSPSSPPTSSLSSAPPSSSSSSSSPPPSSPLSSSSSPSSSSSSAAPATTQSDGAPGFGAVVGVGAGVVAAGAAVGAIAFGVDVNSRMTVANDKATSQLDAQALVDRANVSLAAATVLGGVAVVGVATSVIAFVWSE